MLTHYKAVIVESDNVMYGDNPKTRLRLDIEEVASNMITYKIKRRIVANTTEENKYVHKIAFLENELERLIDEWADDMGFQSRMDFRYMKCTEFKRVD